MPNYIVVSSFPAILIFNLFNILGRVYLFAADCARTRAEKSASLAQAQQAYLSSLRLVTSIDRAYEQDDAHLKEGVQVASPNERALMRLRALNNIGASSVHQAFFPLRNVVGRNCRGVVMSQRENDVEGMSQGKMTGSQILSLFSRYF